MKTWHAYWILPASMRITDSVNEVVNIHRGSDFSTRNQNVMRAIQSSCINAASVPRGSRNGYHVTTGSVSNLTGLVSHRQMVRNALPAGR